MNGQLANQATENLIGIANAFAPMFDPSSMSKAALMRQELINKQLEANNLPLQGDLLRSHIAQADASTGLVKQQTTTETLKQEVEKEKARSEKIKGDSAQGLVDMANRAGSPTGAAQTPVVPMRAGFSSPYLPLSSQADQQKAILLSSVWNNGSDNLAKAMGSNTALNAKDFSGLSNGLAAQGVQPPEANKGVTQAEAASGAFALDAGKAVFGAPGKGGSSSSEGGLKPMNTKEAAATTEMANGLFKQATGQDFATVAHLPQAKELHAGIFQALRESNFNQAGVARNLSNLFGDTSVSRPLFGMFGTSMPGYRLTPDGQALLNRASTLNGVGGPLVNPVAAQVLQVINNGGVVPQAQAGPIQTQAAIPQTEAPSTGASPNAHQQQSSPFKKRLGSADIANGEHALISLQQAQGRMNVLRNALQSGKLQVQSPDMPGVIERPLSNDEYNNLLREHDVLATQMELLKGTAEKYQADKAAAGQTSDSPDWLDAPLSTAYLKLRRFVNQANATPGVMVAQ